MYTRNEKIVPIYIEEEMKASYISYAMSVIIGRALPDVRDGLKPVHRRILYAMNELSLDHTKPYKKSARIVGEVLGKFHPHGDVAVYDTLVRMVQDFSLRYPLVDGQGNFGCFTKDTKVKLVDGRDISFRELIEEYKNGKKNYTYTINRSGLISIAEIKNPRLTINNAEIVKVILDNGAEIKCTPNHRFMLRNGAYKEGKDLTAGESLMPLYQKLSEKTGRLSRDGYCLIYQNVKNEWVPVHHLADNYNLTLGKYYNRQEDLLYKELNYNHKVLRIEFLSQKEDVYDLTIDGTHNFALAAGVFVHNSVDGDAPAAMRYTEARMASITDEILKDIDKDTVDFVPNFDESLQEPTVMPSALPNLLINGSSGIAVGMATNVPPHNLGEVVEGICMLIDNPEALVKDLMKAIKGPDFPTGAVICGREGIKNAYNSGRGIVKLRARASIEEQKGGKEAIIITEIPYQVNKANLIEAIAGLIQEKKIEGISDIRDESDKDGMRIVVELKRDTMAQVILNQLYKRTQMEETFGVIMLALVNGRPVVLNLKQALEEYINHRKIIVTRRTVFELNKAKKRAHILEGLKIAVGHIDEIVKLIKKSKNTDEARENLIKKYSLSEIQAQAILEMQLQRLTGLEREKLDQEYLEVIKKIEYYESILKSEKKIYTIIKEETLAIKEKYADPRRTDIVAEAEDLEIEDLIAEEDAVITISHAGYIKRLPVSAYRKQRRGGKGVTGAELKEEDFVEHLFIATTHEHILFFTNKGKVFWVKVHEIPQASRISKGKAMINLVQLSGGETITAFVPVKEFNQDKFLVMATRWGLIKKTQLSAFSNPRKGGIIACTLEPDDELIGVVLTDGHEEILLGTKEGKAIRFPESQVRDMGRAAKGVKAITLNKKDIVIDMEIVKKEATILTVTSLGFGKRTELKQYRAQSRGGKGIINLKVTSKNGVVVGLKTVTDKDETMLITTGGIIVRTAVKDIRSTGRSTQGVRIIKLGQKDLVSGVARVVVEEEEAEEK